MGRALGLGAVTNFGVAAEVPGIMPDEAYHNRVTPGGYQGGMALNTAIGQGDVNVTPLQLAVMYSAVANGGSVWEPQVVRRVEDWQGETVKEFSPRLVRKVPITEEQRLIVVDALTAVVNEAGGTAFRSRIGDITMAGKTGTAQVGHLGAVRLKKEQMSYWERDHAWFAAFAPAEDPELTVVVLNEHGGHGGSDAAPCASAIMKKYFELKKLDGVAFGRDWQPPVARAPVPPPSRPVDAGSPRVASAADAGVAPIAAEPLRPQEVR
jgi:penicillin-binding protein 2